MRLDPYSRTLVRFLQRRRAEWDRSPPTAQHIGRPTSRGPLAATTTVHGLPIPREDEDWPGRSPLQRVVHRVLRSRALPLHDDDTRWAEDESAEAQIRDLLGDRLVPPRNVAWQDPTADRTQSQLAFQGLASHLLQRLPPGREDGAAFVVDTSWMSELPVREGYERYGAAAFFDASRRLTKVHWGHEDRLVDPGDPQWEHACFAWRASVLAQVTLCEHLWGLHLVMGMAVDFATREQLRPDHPLRLLVKPFCFRATANADVAAHILLPERGLLHRTFGFTYDGLLAALPRGEALATLVPFDAVLRENGTESLDGFPFADDALALTNAIRRWVDAYTGLYWPTPAALLADVELLAWWSALGRLLPDRSRLLRREQLVELLTALIFRATGLHNHVGQVCEYVLDPGFLSPRIRPGRACNDVQGTLLGMLIVAGTALPQPMLMSDLSHLVPTRHAREARDLLAGFMGELGDISDRIAARNRDAEHPYRCLDPARVKCSPSI